MLILMIMASILADVRQKKGKNIVSTDPSFTILNTTVTTRIPDDHILMTMDDLVAIKSFATSHPISDGHIHSVYRNGRIL